MSRDLSPFQPPSRAVAIAPPPSAPPAPVSGVAVADPPTIPAPPEVVVGEWDDTPRHKVTTSIPARLHRLLRDETERSDQFKGDLVIDALHAHGETLSAVQGERPVRRRVRVEDATQCQLYLTDTERQEIDGLARRLGQSRSGVVTALLERRFSS